MKWNPELSALTDEWFDANFSHIPSHKKWEKLNEQEVTLKEKYQALWENQYYLLREEASLAT